jgi:hypothetical protein
MSRDCLLNHQLEKNIEAEKQIDPHRFSISITTLNFVPLITFESRQIPRLRQPKEGISPTPMTQQTASRISILKFDPPKKNAGLLLTKRSLQLHISGPQRFTKPIVTNRRRQQELSELNKPPANAQTTFGFISVREIEGLGHCGGLLIVSQIGRPIEFHCSAPVVTNRAQKILYGKTYDNYLYCEQIGLSLVDKAKTKPPLYFADSLQLIGLEKLIGEMIVVLENDSNRNSFDGPTGLTAVSLETHGRQIWCPPRASQNLPSIRELCGTFTRSLPLDEPFERIQKAIDEAQAVAR